MEEIKEMTIEELAKEYEKQVEDNKKELEGLSVDELKKREEELLKESDEWNNGLKEKTYKLPSKLTWNGKDITRNQIGARIRTLLDTLEVEFSYTLGYYQIAKFWAKPEKEINYSMLDSTLRVLGNGLRFKGINAWENILIINEYFKSNNDEYTKDLLKTMLYANLHNNIIDKLQMESKLDDDSKEDSKEIN